MAETNGNLTLASFTVMLGLAAQGITALFHGRASWNQCLVCSYVLFAVKCSLLCALCEAKRDLRL